MNSHNNARLTPRGREDLVRAVVDNGLTKAEAARRFNTSWRTVHKWVERFRKHGVEALRDRSSRPHSSPSQTTSAICDEVEMLRRRRYTGHQIARELGLSPATVCRILKRRGLNLLASLEPAEPRPRYERQAPGELLHLDIKRLNRFEKVGHRITGHIPGHQRSIGAGYEFAHVAIDDHSRVGRIDIYPNEKKESVIAALEKAIAYYKDLGVTVTRIMTDNGSAYRSRAFAQTCKRLGLKHIFTKPYTPQTNGKAERFIQTVLREWAYATAFENSDQRNAELDAFLHRYNWHRPHASLAGMPPISRLGLTGNNVMRLHI